MGGLGFVESSHEPGGIFLRAEMRRAASVVVAAMLFVLAEVRPSTLGELFPKSFGAIPQHDLWTNMTATVVAKFLLVYLQHEVLLLLEV